MVRGVGRRVIEHGHYPRLDLAAEATPLGARELRVRLERWLRWSGATPTRAADLSLAVYEALANAVEHAYPPEHHDPGVWLHAERDHDHVLISISDTGTWRTPDESGFRGRGMDLIRQLATDVRIDPTPQGTTVHLRAGLVVADTNGAGHW